MNSPRIHNPHGVMRTTVRAGIRPRMPQVRGPQFGQYRVLILDTTRSEEACTIRYCGMLAEADEYARRASTDSAETYCVQRHGSRGWTFTGFFTNGRFHGGNGAFCIDK